MTETTDKPRPGKPKGHPKPDNSGRIAGEDGEMRMMGFRATKPFKKRIETAARRAGQKPSDWMRAQLEAACLVSEREEIQSRIL